MSNQPSAYCQLNIVGEIQEKHVDYYQLQENSGLVIKFPKNLVFANGLKIEDQKIGLTKSLYDRWLEIETAEKLKAYNELLYNNFSKLFDIREKITTEKGFYYLQPSWLYSGGIYIGTFRYTLGALFNTWLTSDRLNYQGNQIIKIGGSGLSGANIYEAWDLVNKKIIKGSVSDPQIHWHQYVKVFRSLGEEKRFGTGQNFLQSKNLLDTLEINF
ncbi:MAG: hypothetical protein ACO21X_05555 [Sediminibacterium sp.]